MLSIRTVPSDYSWDKGTPAVTFTNLVSSLDKCRKFSNNSKGVEYVGYAPFVSVALSSDSGNTNPTANIKRIVNFGDYYNSDSNIVADSRYDSTVFSHAYVMPGLYSITIERQEYVVLRVKDPTKFGACFQKYCLEWYWANLNSNYTTLPRISAYTWKATKSTSPVLSTDNVPIIGPKKWKREPCEQDDFSGAGFYVQQADYLNTKRAPLSWQWFNFSQTSPGNLLNTVTPWISTGFQQPDQLSWKETSGPCLQNLNYHGTDIIWKWDFLTLARAGARFASTLTWDQARSIEPRNVTWDFAGEFCIGDMVNLTLSTGIVTMTNEKFIRVLEIPPQAYLQVIQPDDRLSPLTVTLSPRNIISGSFPIEKIVWDLGDGSPLLVQRRWSPTLEAPFVYSGILSDDYEDPRNYDIVHTYRKTPNSPYVFYPSLTAYASSTGTVDTVTAVVGPLKYGDPAVTFNLLQTELTDEGKVIVGQVNGNLGIWKADK